MKNYKTTYIFLSICLIGTIAFLSTIFLFSFAQSDEQGPYPMNLSISTSIAITISNRLAQGIFYTNDTGSASNVQYPVNTGQAENATWNYGGGTGGTFYNITNAGTTAEDICGKASTNLTCSPLTPGCGSNTILLTNSTWSNSTTSTPAYPGSNIWTGSYNTVNLTAIALPKSNTIHVRYWLNVPANIDSGTYNTTFAYCAVESGQPCTC